MKYSENNNNSVPQQWMQSAEPQDEQLAAAFLALADSGPTAPARFSSLTAALERDDQHKEQTYMKAITRLLQGRPWYQQLGLGAALLALLAAFAALLPWQPQHGKGTMGLSPAAAWASSEEFALVFDRAAIDHVHESAESLRHRLMEESNIWAAEMCEMRGLLSDEIPVGRYFEVSDDGSMRVFLIFAGASRGEIEELKARADSILGQPLTKVEEATLLFPEGLPPVEYGIAKAISDSVFCVPGEVDDENVHQQLMEWLKARGFDAPHGEN